jgi:hypothetical protein
MPQSMAGVSYREGVESKGNNKLGERQKKKFAVVRTVQCVPQIFEKTRKSDRTRQSKTRNQKKKKIYICKCFFSIFLFKKIVCSGTQTNKKAQKKKNKFEHGPQHYYDD